MPFPSPGVSSHLRDRTRVSPMAGRFKSLLQDHNLKASILQCSAFILLKNKLSWEESHNLMANNDFPREFSPSDSIERVQHLPGFRQPGSEVFLQTFSGGRSCLCSKIQVPRAWEVWGGVQVDLLVIKYLCYNQRKISGSLPNIQVCTRYPIF